MSGLVTVEHAIARGRMMIHMPATCIMLGAIAQALIIVPTGSAPMLVLFVSAAIGLSGWPMAWLYRMVMTPRWKLWAYSGAGNVREMKDEAIKAKVIAPDDSFAEKSEICSKEVRQQILKLEGRA